MTNNERVVYEIAILGRATWNLHSLNNEGTVGNVTEPRTIMLADGRKTDGISGEMLKHIHAEKMWELESNKSNFCDACKQLNPEKANADKGVISTSTPEDAVKTALTKCELCDIHGFLVNQPTVARSSVVEFGWALGIPQVARDIHTHARHSVYEQAPTDEKEIGKWETEKCSIRGCQTNPEESKLYKVGNKWYCEDHLPTGQMVYHRPTRSGIYAIISVFQPWRIGLNNVSMKYNVGDNDRKSRYQLALKAYQAMFLRPEGAMTSTRLPHTEKFEGIIVISRTNYPVPVISPLKDKYEEEINNIVNKINNPGKKTGTQNEGTSNEKKEENIEVKNFKNLEEFVEIINKLLNDKPYKLQESTEKEQKKPEEKKEKIDNHQQR